MFRPAEADNARQALSAAGGGDNPKAELRLAEFRGLRGDPDVARQRQLEPAAERVAVDRRDRRPRKSLDRGADGRSDARESVVARSRP